MAYNNNNTDWISKEQRELFCKAVNSMIMTDITLLKDLDKVLGSAEKIVDKAFDLYPDKIDDAEVVPL